MHKTELLEWGQKESAGDSLVIDIMISQVEFTKKIQMVDLF